MCVCVSLASMHLNIPSGKIQKPDTDGWDFFGRKIKLACQI